MVLRTMQSLTSAISPPEGEGLSRYLDAIVRVLGVQSDAGLARLMEVSPAIVANWRRRQVVSRSAADWFENDLIKHLSHKKSYLFEQTFEAVAVMEVLRRTQIDPLSIGKPDNTMACEAVPPLMSLAYVIFNGSLHWELDADWDREGKVADILMEALPLLRRRLMPGHEGPQ